MDLLERDHCFDQLSALLCTATTGNGRTVLISGEAGIGKTALVEQFVSRHRGAARRLWGACEALFTPRPLGPLYDIATQAQGSLSSLMGREAPRSLVFSALLDELQQSPLPTIVVFEDVHWADEATLDLIKFLGRRIPQLPVLFLVTYRDDELGRDHPLWSVIGDLPGNAVARLRLVPLSEHAVTCLANLAHRSADQLYAVTGGNPFFVTEVLASVTDGVPLMVRDAVLARIARVSLAGRTLLELASVVPTRTERWLLDSVLGTAAAAEAMEECLSSGMLSDEARTLALASGELQRIAPVAAARAEAAWLRGDQEQCLAEARVGYERALTHRYPWKLGELSLWMWRVGGLTSAPGHVAEPFARQIAGDWRGAAALWEQMGCPYEQALALADGDAEAMRNALALLERLGAQPAMSLVRRRLQQQGIAGIPRGPRASTRTNQAGLTSRQLEVLELMVEGCSNAEIASRLFTSPKTVEHHVSAVLAKLGVHSRAQAISAAHHLELLPNIGEPKT